MHKLADEFQRGIGAKLQRYLILKSWWVNIISGLRLGVGSGLVHCV